MRFLPVIAYVGAAMAFLLGLAAVRRSPRAPSQWAFAIGMGLLALESFCTGRIGAAEPNATLLSWHGARFVVSVFLACPWLAFSLTYARGNHMEFLRRWALPLLVLLGLAVLTVLIPWKAMVGNLEVSPAGDRWLLELRPLGRLIYFLQFIAAVVMLVNLERTFHTSVGTMRWKIKYMLLGVGLLFASRLYTWSQALLFNGIGPAMLAANASALLVSSLIIARGLFREGAFKADLYPSHKLLSNSLIILLAGAYLFIVGLIAKVVSSLGGDAAFPLKSFLVFAALTALAIVLLSDRFRSHVGRLVSRHLRRPRYDYRNVWRTFMRQTASRLSNVDYCRAVAQCVSDTMDVLAVTVWLVDEAGRQLVFGGSTKLSQAEAAALLGTENDFLGAINALRHNPVPVNLEELKVPWASGLRRLNERQFRQGGSGLCVPVMAGPDLLGLLLLSDRVSGVPYSIEEIELLQCMADQIGNGLLNIGLSDRLLRAREMEAFQTMSAFFVHDLKNVGYALSLTLDNLRTHFDNPEFREDAFKAIAKSAGRLDALISRLGLLRLGHDLHTAPADLNAAIRAALASVPFPPQATLDQDLRPLPQSEFDTDQIQKVVTNLIVNALEASANRGCVRIATERRDGWLVLSVTDNGCGMSPEFIARSLFRPFQTSKSKGVGLGLFHCKTIVEAHRGRIEVESQENKGTSFRVLLPLIERSA